MLRFYILFARQCGIVFWSPESYGTLVFECIQWRIIFEFASHLARFSHRSYLPPVGFAFYIGISRVVGICPHSVWIVWSLCKFSKIWICSLLLDSDSYSLDSSLVYTQIHRIGYYQLPPRHFRTPRGLFLVFLPETWTSVTLLWYALLMTVSVFLPANERMWNKRPTGMLASHTCRITHPIVRQECSGSFLLYMPIWALWALVLQD